MYAVQDATQNECLAGFYQPRDICFQGVSYQFHLSKDPLDISFGQTDY
jgi:hypothetical protein